MNAQSTVDLRSGNTMPVMGLGTWQLTGNRCIESVSTALELGYRMIDTASDYNNHTQVGEALSKSSVPREEIYLVTKVEETDDAYAATKSYVRQLGLAYANLMVVHRPPAQGIGIDLWQGLIQAKAAGLTKDIGVSNYSIKQIEELVKRTGMVPVVNQIEWSPFGYSKDMLHYCQQKDIVIQAYSPLTRDKRLGEGTVRELAEKYGKSPAQIIIRWDIQHGVVPIIKATSSEHLAENSNVFDFALSNTDLERLDSLNEHYSSFGTPLQYA